VNVNIIHTTYVNQTIVQAGIVANPNHVAYNGGPGGIQHTASPAEQAVEHEPHTAPTAMQTQHAASAQADKASFAKANGGHPANLVASKLQVAQRVAPQATVKDNPRPSPQVAPKTAVQQRPAPAAHAAPAVARTEAHPAVHSAPNPQAQQHSVPAARVTPVAHVASAQHATRTQHTAPVQHAAPVQRPAPAQRAAPAPRAEPKEESKPKEK
jgi:hypothetical protein